MTRYRLAPSCDVYVCLNLLLTFGRSVRLRYAQLASQEQWEQARIEVSFYLSGHRIDLRSAVLDAAFYVWRFCVFVSLCLRLCVVCVYYVLCLCAFAFSCLLDSSVLVSIVYVPVLACVFG